MNLNNSMKNSQNLSVSRGKSSSTDSILEILGSIPIPRHLLTIYHHISTITLPSISPAFPRSYLQKAKNTRSPQDLTTKITNSLLKTSSKRVQEFKQWMENYNGLPSNCARLVRSKGIGVGPGKRRRHWRGKLQAPSVRSAPIGVQIATRWKAVQWMPFF